MRLVIKGGKVFDPSCGWDGIEQDLFIDQGRLVHRLEGCDRVIAAHGLAVTPAAIDLRSTVASFGQNFLRLWGVLPSPREVGETYARLGYTHIHEPLLTLATANYVHHELDAIPIVDTSASLTLNLRDYDLWLKDPAKLPEVALAWATLLDNCRALNLRVVEPFVKYRQEFYRHRTLEVEFVVRALRQVAELAGLPLTVEAGPELLAADLPELPGIQLGALGPALESDALAAKALRLLEQGVVADMGLMPPQPRPETPSSPASLDLGWFLPFKLNPAPEPEVARRALQLAFQGRQYDLAFSAAASALMPVSSFPLVFAWLGDQTQRHRDWGGWPPTPDFSIYDWVRSTRTLPARYLGLPDKGHLRPGARADIALYDLPVPGTASSWQESFGRCRLLLKGGEIVVDNYAVVNRRVNQTRFYRASHTSPNQVVADLVRLCSFRRENLLVRPRAGLHWQQAP